MRKVMVVALARKLLIALWRFATQGVVPEGAVSPRFNRSQRLSLSRTTARAHGSKGASPLSGLVHSRRLKEWRRPPGALPSRMRDHGGDSVPPDVRFAGKTCVDESSALVDQLNRAAVPKSEERRNEVA